MKYLMICLMLTLAACAEKKGQSFIGQHINNAIAEYGQPERQTGSTYGWINRGLDPYGPNYGNISLANSSLPTCILLTVDGSQIVTSENFYKCYGKF